MNPPNVGNPPVTPQNQGQQQWQQQWQQDPRVAPLSDEEQRMIRECGNEALYRRSLPFAVMAGASTYWAIVQNYLKPSSRFGAFPKVALAVFCGHMLGKASYVSICREKILREIPDSDLAKRIRSGRGLPPRENGEDDAPSNAAAMAQLEDEVFQPQDEMLRSPDGKKSVTTYEELRKRNREDYNKPTIIPFPHAPSPQGSPTPSREAHPPIDPGDSSYSPPSKMRRRPLNQYGDEGFE